MKLKELTGNISYLAGPFFVFYVVRGSKQVALIELGISQLVPQVLNDIKGSMGGREPDILIAPHGHFDHAGASSRWKKELPYSILCASELAAATLADENSLAPYIRSMQSASATPFFKDVFPLAEDQPFIEPVKFDRILKDGDVIELGGCELEVISTPGHSACSLSLHHAPSGTLFVSDACGLPLPSGRIWPSAFFDRELYKESLEKLMRKDAEHICFGHNAPMSGMERNRRFFMKNLEALDNFFSRIGQLWTELGDRDAVHKALYSDYQNDGAAMLSFVFKYGNKEMARQVIDGVRGRG